MVLSVLALRSEAVLVLERSAAPLSPHLLQAACLAALLLLENMGVVGDQGYLPFYWAIKPSLLVFRGRILPSRLKSERVAEAEILAALRDQGVARLEDAHAVVLETDGSFSVIQQGPADTLGNVDRPAEA